MVGARELIFLIPDCTFAQLWSRYATLKAATWSTATRKAVTSVFGGKSSRTDHPSVLDMIGARRVVITREPLQELLNNLAGRGDSSSAVKKVGTYLSAALELARDERLVSDNAARKLELPTQLLAPPSERYYSLEEVQQLIAQAHGREHLVLRIFINCGLRPGELFALREDDIEPGQLRIDEAVKEVERGAKRLGETKTVGSRAYVGISTGLQEELELWVQARRQVCSYHAKASASSSDLLFPSETGTPFRLGNYLKRYLPPLGKKAGIPDLTYQALRRTCATHFQKHGKPRDIQAQFRHTKLEMTGRYIKEIPDQVRAAVERMDPRPGIRLQAQNDRKQTTFDNDWIPLGLWDGSPAWDMSHQIGGDGSAAKPASRKTLDTVANALTNYTPWNDHGGNNWKTKAVTGPDGHTYAMTSDHPDAVLDQNTNRAYLIRNGTLVPAV